METVLLKQYQTASEWFGDKVAGTNNLDLSTPCDEWNVRQLLNHVLETQRYFAGAARGEDVAPPGQTPPTLLSDDPAEDFAIARADVLSAFGQDGVIDKTGPTLGIAFSDQLLHGWDLARATGQETTMPEGLAEAAYDAIHGRFTEEQRHGVFKPELAPPEGGTPQQRLLAYTGRPPG